MTAFSHIRSAALTDVGRRRKNNEDAFGSFPSVGVFCVADGMGGGDDGEIASAATVQSVERIVSDLTPPDGFAFAGDRVADAVSGAVNAASNWIFRRAQAKRIGGCGSTFVAIRFDAAMPSSALALHAGDSRLYRVRKGEIKQLTADHSAANMMGAKTESEVNPMFRSMILRAVGVAERVDLERTKVDVMAGDRFFLCSDGLSRMVPDEKLLETCRSHVRPDEAARAFVDAANSAGGLDNITVIVMDVGELPAALPVAEGPRESPVDKFLLGEAYLGDWDVASDSSGDDDLMSCSVSEDGVNGCAGTAGCLRRMVRSVQRIATTAHSRVLNWLGLSAKRTPCAICRHEIVPHCAAKRPGTGFAV